jgi:DNA modification methylase
MHGLHEPWIINSDTLTALKMLPAQSVHCAVTSPPYFGLRNYQLPPTTWSDGWVGCLGLEPTPDLYIDHLVEVCHEVFRVLRNDGVFWLNIGDSYNNFRCEMGPGQAVHGRDKLNGKPEVKSRRRGSAGLKEKDLIGVPWMAAFALRDDGWYLRKDNIWQKPNPMPESCRDRTTSSHEYVFHLTKKPFYFYDAEAIKETGVIPAGTRGARGSAERFNTPGVNSRPPEYKIYDGMRNARDVWTITTKPYKHAHFATMPMALAERCIKAGTSEAGCCAQCGAPWLRQFSAKVPANGRGSGNGFKRDQRLTYVDDNGARGDETPWTPTVRTTTGWLPSCQCPFEMPMPCTVLDPFGGSGTTGAAAYALGRNSVLIELSEIFCQMANNRIHRPGG